MESSTPHPWPGVHPAIHPLSISQPKCSATHPWRAANPQCHLSPHLTSLCEAHDGYDSFWPSLKKLLLISLSLKDDKKELLRKTRSLCSIRVSNQRDSKKGKDRLEYIRMYYPNSSERWELLLKTNWNFPAKKSRALSCDPTSGQSLSPVPALSSSSSTEQFPEHLHQFWICRSLACPSASCRGLHSCTTR